MSTDGLYYGCCVMSEVLQRQLWMDFRFDPCDYSMEVNLENINKKFELLQYQWGKYSLKNHVIINNVGTVHTCLLRGHLLWRCDEI